MSRAAMEVLHRGGIMSGDEHQRGWEALLPREWPQRRKIDAAIVLLSEQVFEVNRLLPEGCHWYPYLSELIGPVGSVAPSAEELEAVLRQAADAVTLRVPGIVEELVKGWGDGDL